MGGVVVPNRLVRMGGPRDLPRLAGDGVLAAGAGQFSNRFLIRLSDVAAVEIELWSEC